MGKELPERVGENYNPKDGSTISTAQSETLSPNSASRSRFRDWDDSRSNITRKADGESHELHSALSKASISSPERPLEEDPKCQFIAYCHGVCSSEAGLKKPFGDFYDLRNAMPLGDGGSSAVYRLSRNDKYLQKAIESGRQDIPSPLPKFVACRRRRPQPELRRTHAADDTESWHNLFVERTILENAVLKNHRNIHHLLGVDLIRPMTAGVGELTVDQLPMFFFEFAELGELKMFLDRKKTATGSISDGLMMSLALDIGRGLESLHANYIAHTDLKPENILIFNSDDTGADGVVAKIADFGGAVIGLDGMPNTYSPLWAAPEQVDVMVKDSEITVTHIEATRWDSFSYGLILWYISTEGADPLSCVRDFFIDAELPCESCGETWRRIKKSPDKFLRILGTALGHAHRSRSGIVGRKLWEAILLLIQSNPLDRNFSQALRKLTPEGHSPRDENPKSIWQHTTLYDVKNGLRCQYFGSEHDGVWSTNTNTVAVDHYEAQLINLPRWLRLVKAIRAIPNILYATDEAADRAAISMALEKISRFPQRLKYRKPRWSEVILARESGWVLVTLVARDKSTNRSLFKQELEAQAILEQEFGLPDEFSSLMTRINHADEVNQSWAGLLYSETQTKPGESWIGSQCSGKTKLESGLGSNIETGALGYPQPKATELPKHAMLMSQPVPYTPLERFKVDPQRNKALLKNKAEFSNIWPSDAALSAFLPSEPVTIFADGLCHRAASDPEASSFLQSLLDSNPHCMDRSPNQMNILCETPLHIAFQAGNTAAAIFLLAMDLSVEVLELNPSFVEDISQFPSADQADILQMLIPLQPKWLFRLLQNRGKGNSLSITLLSPVQQAILFGNEPLIDALIALANEYLDPAGRQDYFWKCASQACQMYSIPHVIKFHTEIRDAVGQLFWMYLIRTTVLFSPLLGLILHGVSKSLRLLTTVDFLLKECEKAPTTQSQNRMVLDLDPQFARGPFIEAVEFDLAGILPRFQKFQQSTSILRALCRPTWPALAVCLAKGDLVMASRIKNAIKEPLALATTTTRESLGLPKRHLKQTFFPSLESKSPEFLRELWTPGTRRRGINRAEIVNWLLDQGWAPTEEDIVNVFSFIYSTSNEINRKYGSDVVLKRILAKGEYSSEQIQYMMLELLSPGKSTALSALLQHIKLTRAYSLKSLILNLPDGNSFFHIIAGFSQTISILDPTWIRHTIGLLLEYLKTDSEAMGALIHDKFLTSMWMKHGIISIFYAMKDVFKDKMRNDFFLDFAWSIYDKAVAERASVSRSIWQQYEAGTGTILGDGISFSSVLSFNGMLELSRSLRSLSIGSGGRHEKRAQFMNDFEKFVKNLASINISDLIFCIAPFGFTLTECSAKLPNLRGLCEMRVFIDDMLTLVKAFWKQPGPTQYMDYVRLNHNRNDVSDDTMALILWLISWPFLANHAHYYAFILPGPDSDESAISLKNLEVAKMKLLQLATLFDTHDEITSVPDDSLCPEPQNPLFKHFIRVNQVLSALSVVDPDIVRDHGFVKFDQQMAGSVLQNVVGSVSEGSKLDLTDPAASQSALDITRSLFKNLAGPLGLLFPDKDRVGLRKVALEYLKTDERSLDDFVLLWFKAISLMRRCELFIYDNSTLAEESIATKGKPLRSLCELAELREMLAEGLLASKVKTGTKIPVAYLSLVIGSLQVANFFVSLIPLPRPNFVSPWKDPTYLKYITSIYRDDLPNARTFGSQLVREHFLISDLKDETTTKYTTLRVTEPAAASAWEADVRICSLMLNNQFGRLLEVNHSSGMKAPLLVGRDSAVIPSLRVPDFVRDLEQLTKKMAPGSDAIDMPPTMKSAVMGVEWMLRKGHWMLGLDGGILNGWLGDSAPLWTGPFDGDPLFDRMIKGHRP